jgi:hypothetical protein
LKKVLGTVTTDGHATWIEQLLLEKLKDGYRHCLAVRGGDKERAAAARSDSAFDCVIGAAAAEK